MAFSPSLSLLHQFSKAPEDRELAEKEGHKAELSDQERSQQARGGANWMGKGLQVRREADSLGLTF